MDALSTSARGKPVCGQTQGSGFLQQWKHKRFFKKKKGQGLLCFVGNILVSRLKKQDQVLAGSEGRLEAEEVALVSGEQQPGCGCARWPRRMGTSSSLAIISPSLPGHKKYCHRQVCSLCSLFICLQPFVLSPLPSALCSKTRLLGIALATGKVGISTVNPQPP